jgi:predicted nucleic acid-binding protein
MYLLGFSFGGQDALWEMIGSESLGLAVLDRADAPRMRQLMQKYRDLPMDLADAALVRVAEREKISRIFTLDRRHFRIYRPAGIARLSLLPLSGSRSG